AGLTAAVFLLLTSVAVVSSVLALRIAQKAKEAQAEANRANDEAKRKNLALAAEAKERERTQALLADQFVHRGAGMLADGDPSGAALCFAKALPLDPPAPDRTAMHRLRLAAALRDSPRPRQVLFHSTRVLCTAVSPDGKLLAAGCDDGAVIVWDLATGTRVGEPFRHEHAVQQVAFAADGRPLLTSIGPPQVPGYRLTLWDRASGQVIKAGPSYCAPKFNIRTTGRDAWVGFMSAANTLELRDAGTGEPVGPAIQTDRPITSWTGSGRA